MDCGPRHNNSAPQDIDQQAHIYKLVGIQRIIFVVEDGFEFRRSCGGIDLIVRSQQDAIGDFFRIVVIPRLDPELLAGAQLLQDIAQIVFGNAEQDCDRFKLRDDHHAVWIRRADNVAFIDQPQSDLAADRRNDS